MKTLKVAHVSGVGAEPSSGLLTVGLQLDDGSPVNLVLDGPTAQVLALATHQTALKLLDRTEQGPIESGQVQAYRPQTVHMSHDVRTRTAVVLFDHEKPTQAAYHLTEKLISDLGQGLTRTMQALFGQSHSSRLN